MLAKSGFRQPSFPTTAGQPAPHLTLEFTLLLEAEVFRSVSHHGEGLLGVVSAKQKKHSGRPSEVGSGTSGHLTEWQFPLIPGQPDPQQQDHRGSGCPLPILKSGFNTGRRQAGWLSGEDRAGLSGCWPERTVLSHKETTGTLSEGFSSPLFEDNLYLGVFHKGSRTLSHPGGPHQIEKMGMGSELRLKWRPMERGMWDRREKRHTYPRGFL